MRKIALTLVVLLAALWVLAACGGRDEPTATPEPPAVEEPTAAPEPTATPEPTVAVEAPAEPVTDTEEMTATAAVTATEEMTAAEEITATEEVTAAEAMTEEVAAAAGITETKAVTTPAVAETEAVTATEEVTAEVAAPAPATLTVVSGRELSDVVGASDPVFSALSPDGTMMAFAQQTGRRRNKERSICIFTFANSSLNCYEAPEEYKGYPVALVWSPDSSTVAFTEDPVTLGYDSDIWVLDAASGEYANRTDDGVTGSYPSAETGTFSLDYLPMWNAQDGQIYFWRVVPKGTDDFQFTLALARVSPTEGDAEVLDQIDSSLPGKLSLYDNEAYFLDGVSTLSPDGTKVAALFITVLGDPYAGSQGSLFLVDLSGEELTVSELADYAAFQTALPPFQYSPATPLGLSWTADSKGVVVAAASPDTHTPLLLFYYVDAASGEIAPVVDFSGYDEYEAFFEPDESGIPPRYYSPWTGSLAPTGDQLLMLSDLGGVASVFAAPLPPTGELPTVLKAAEDIVYSSGGSRSSRSVDGKVTMYELLITLSAE